MPTRPSKNVVQKMIEFPPELAAEVETFAGGRGQSFKEVVCRALRRHMDNPPPVVKDPPLPDGPPEVVPASAPKKPGPKPRTPRAKKT